MSLATTPHFFGFFEIAPPSVANTEFEPKGPPVAFYVIGGGQVLPKFPHVFTWPDGTLYKPDWVTRTFTALVAKAGIRYCTPHDLRRSFSTIAQRAGVDRSIVKDLGGWSNVNVLERHYTGDVSEAHRRAMDKIAHTA
ncbi:MAG: site-specific integrase [Phycisphaerae bacterium]|jgi:integrase|nr:site-specific integrase [Phycisphaerae bacterium]MDP7636842.1 site-specific integrase [Phycisphaerae bacterium]